MLMQKIKTVFTHKKEYCNNGEFYVVDGKIEPVRYCQPTRWNPDFKISCDPEKCPHYASFLKGKVLYNGRTQPFAKLSRCCYPSNLSKEQTLSILQSEMEKSHYFIRLQE